MKKRHQLLAAALFCFAPSFLFAQTEPEISTELTEPARVKTPFFAGFHSEARLNCTNFISKVIGKESETASEGTPFTVGYTLFYKKIGLRAGAGWRSLENLNAGGSNNNAPILVGQSQKDFRLGLEYEHKLSKHWRVSVGADGLYGWGDNALKTFFTDAFGNLQEGRIGEIQTRYGGGGFVGIKYFFNDRVGLATETTCYWMRQKTVQQNDFYIPVAEKPDETTQSTNLEPPVALYFFFRF